MAKTLEEPGAVASADPGFTFRKWKERLTPWALFGSGLVVAGFAVWMPAFPENLALGFLWSLGVLGVIFGIFLIPAFVVGWLRVWLDDRRYKESRWR